MANIFLQINGQQAGPYTIEQVQAMVGAGQVSADTLAWQEGMSSWRPVAEVLGGTVPPPPPPPRKQGLSATMITLIVLGAVAVLCVPCLAGVALGPITNGIRQAKNNATLQQSHAIGLALFSYSTDNNGKYPDGKTSTEVFQKLIDGSYVADPSIFYVDGIPGKVKPTGNHLTADNVCFDFTSGVTAQSSDQVPLVFLTGFDMSYQNGATATRAEPTPFAGIAVFYKGNSAQFLKEVSGTPIVVSVPFDANGETYTQLKP
jgi:hypothetical protein